MEGFAVTDDFRPKFDATITLGHIVKLSGILFAIVGTYYSFNNRLSSVESQIGRMASILEMAIRQDEQIKNLTYRLDRLDNGNKR